MGGPSWLRSPLRRGPRVVARPGRLDAVQLQRQAKPRADAVSLVRPAERGAVRLASAVGGQCATPVAADSIPASASELHKLRESRCYTRLRPRRISRWQRAQRTAAGPAAVQDRLHLIWRHHPRQLLRRLQRDHPRCLGSALADVMQERPPASACAADLPRCQQLADHPGLPLPSSSTLPPVRNRQLD